MSVLEQTALPFYENTDLSDARFPWMTLSEAADRVYMSKDQSLDEMREMAVEPIESHEISMEVKTEERAFAQRVLAYVKRCDEINYDFIDDSEKYYTVRHSMALRVVSLYFDTQHYFDARAELSHLKRELKSCPMTHLFHSYNLHMIR